MSRVVLTGGPRLDSIRVESNSSEYDIKRVKNLSVTNNGSSLQIWIRTVMGDGEEVDFKGPVDFGRGLEMKIS